MHRINKEFYNTLLKSGWALDQIDKADIFFLFDLNKPEVLEYANQVPWL